METAPESKSADLTLEPCRASQQRCKKEPRVWPWRKAVHKPLPVDALEISIQRLLIHAPRPQTKPRSTRLRLIWSERRRTLKTTPIKRKKRPKTM